MGAWAENQGIDGSMISFLADPSCAFTKALDLEMTHPGPVSVLGNVRSKRFAIVFENGVAKNVLVSEGPDDPAGDDDPSASLVTNVLKFL